MAEVGSDTIGKSAQEKCGEQDKAELVIQLLRLHLAGFLDSFPQHCMVFIGMVLLLPNT